MPKAKRATWKTILADAENYPDDFVLTSPDGGSYSIGDLREMNESSKGEVEAALTERENALNVRESNVTKAQNSLLTRIGQAAAAAGVSVEDFVSGNFPNTIAGQRGKKARVALSEEARRATDGVDDGEEGDGMEELIQDPILKDVAPHLKKLQRKISALSDEPQTKAIREELKEVKTFMGQILETYLNDYFGRRYDEKLSALKGDLGDKVTDFAKKNNLESVINFAKDNGYKDKAGRYNIDKAVDELAQPLLQAAQHEKWKKEGAEEERKRGVMARIPKPGVTGPARHKAEPQHTDAKGGTKTLDAAWSDAMQDSELINQFANIAGEA